MPKNEAILQADIARLGEALWSSVAALSGSPHAELCRGLGADAASLRRGELAGGRMAFAAKVADLEESELESAARAHALSCHLMNLAEERARRRALRNWDGEPPDGVARAIDALIEAGASSAELRGFIERALVMPVVTAHPTEARRRSSLDHLTRIAELLEEYDHGGARSQIALDAEVLALHATEDARTRRPTPVDEIETALDVFRRSLMDVTPRVYRTIEDRLTLRLGGTWRLPPFLRWGSWVGGDRDGNPHVTAEVTRTAFARARRTVLTRYLADVERLGRMLSVSARRAVGGASQDLLASLERDRDRLPEVAAHALPRTANEPWREKLWYVHARLGETLHHGEDGYIAVADYRADLDVLDRSLRAAGFAAVADQDLRDALRRADVFGFHLATLDIRQHSDVHARAVDELLARGGRPGYLLADEASRRAMLDAALAAPSISIRDRSALSPQTAELMATLEVVGRARRELGPRACERYIVSFTREISDMIEVVFLARVAGLAPAELRPVPLLEQVEDLERAGEIADGMLEHPILRAEIGGELEIMIGYSDSGKQLGSFASAVALRRAQFAVAGATDRAGVKLTVFHGRGGALGRGGGPQNEAIRGQPVPAIRGRLRVTEQGETVTARYTQPVIAERDLELTLGAVFGAEVDVRCGRREDRADQVVERTGDSSGTRPASGARTLIDVAGEAARRAYTGLTADQDRLARYTLATTPIEDVAHLPIGSRPASRSQVPSLDSLRAIPWVFSWTQSRQGIPGWFGVGSAIDAMVDKLGVDATRDLFEHSRFLRALVHNCEISVVRSDIDVAREYGKLADTDAAQLFTQIADEHARTVHALQVTLGMSPPLASRPYVAASVQRRNPHLDVLSHIQIEALRRRRSGKGNADRLTRIVYTTIGGIAAGLQTAG